MPEASSIGLSRPLAAGLTDVGRQRKHNEDHILVRQDLGLFVVADGMGGHNAGDIASKLTTTSLNNFFEATEDGAPIGELPAEYEGLSDDAKRLVAGVRKANHDVHLISSTYQQHHGMGSTIVATFVGMDGLIHIAHVGDSRCYRIRDGEIEQMTRDHSLINDALEMKPDLTAAELARLPKNIITRALGMKDVVKVDIRTEETIPGDVYILCSDGLSGMVSKNEMLEIISITDDLQEACELLIAEANDAGGTDNISALLIRIDEVQEEPTEDVSDFSEEDVSDFSEEDLDVVSEAMIDSMPVMEVGTADPVAEEAPIDSVVPESFATALASGNEVDLELAGPWSSEPMSVAHCKNCGHELFMGNLFCVECGTRIEEEAEQA